MIHSNDCLRNILAGDDPLQKRETTLLTDNFNFFNLWIESFEFWSYPECFIDIGIMNIVLLAVENLTVLTSSLAVSERATTVILVESIFPITTWHIQNVLSYSSPEKLNKNLPDILLFLGNPGFIEHIGHVSLTSNVISTKSDGDSIKTFQNMRSQPPAFFQDLSLEHLWGIEHSMYGVVLKVVFRATW